jgi:hypothetical protein
MYHLLVVLLVIVGGLWVWDYIFPAPPPSVFPQNLAVLQLTDAEIAYYRQVFDYTMTVTNPGENYDWESQNGKGTFTPEATFVSKSGATCRKFFERYTMGSYGGSVEGLACKRDGREGWCRLKKTDAQTCAMEAPATATDKAARGTKDAIGAAKDVLGKAQGILR